MSVVVHIMASDLPGDVISSVEMGDVVVFDKEIGEGGIILFVDEVKDGQIKGSSNGFFEGEDREIFTCEIGRLTNIQIVAKAGTLGARALNDLAIRGWFDHKRLLEIRRLSRDTSVDINLTRR